jgi:hypothetical protein
MAIIINYAYLFSEFSNLPYKHVWRTKKLSQIILSVPELDFTKKTALDTQLNPPEIKPTEKA